MIVNKELNKTDMYEVANEILSQYSNAIIDLQAEQITQNNNITTNTNDIIDLQNDISTINPWLISLESQVYPEALWTLSDVDITPTITDDNKIIYYDYANDKFKLWVD